MIMNGHWRFLSVMAGAVLLLGILPLLEKEAVARSGSILSLVIAINLVTVAVLLGPGWRARPPSLLLQWQDVLVIGAVASGIVVLLNIWALQTTSATHRSVFQAMYPAATAVFSWFLLRERLPGRTYGVIVLMSIGIVIMCSRGISLRFAPGDALLVTTLPLMGFCDTWVKKSLDRLRPDWVALCRFGVGTTLLLLVGPLSGFGLRFPAAQAWPWIVLSGLCIGGGILLLYRGMELRGASLAAAMIGIAPVITLVLEWALLGGTFTPIELAGMALVVGGGILLSRPRFQGNQVGPADYPLRLE